MINRRLNRYLRPTQIIIMPFGSLIGSFKVPGLNYKHAFLLSTIPSYVAY